MCYKCKKPVTLDLISRSSTCPDCGRDLHSCVNCRFYAPGAHYDCHESSIDELVKDKEKSNFCDYFSVKRNFDGTESSSDDQKAKNARAAFDALFG